MYYNEFLIKTPYPCLHVHQLNSCPCFFHCTIRQYHVKGMIWLKQHELNIMYGDKYITYIKCMLFEQYWPSSVRKLVSNYYMLFNYRSLPKQTWNRTHWNTTYNECEIVNTTFNTYHLSIAIIVITNWHVKDICLFRN